MENNNILSLIFSLGILLAFAFASPLFKANITGDKWNQQSPLIPFQSSVPVPIPTPKVIFRNVSRATQHLHGAEPSYVQVLETILSAVKWCFKFLQSSLAHG